MKAGEREELIRKFENAYALIDELAAGLGDEALNFLPAVPEAWSINDHLVHLLDADAAVFFRIRAAIADPGYAIRLWDEEAWHLHLAYEKSDGRLCLELAKGLRRIIAQCLRAKAEEDWSAYWVEHPSRGRMSLEDLVSAYREHAAFHAPFVKRNRDAYRGEKS